MSDMRMTTVRLAKERWDGLSDNLRRAYRAWQFDLVNPEDGSKIFQMPIKVLKDLQKQEEAHERGKGN